MCKTNSRDKNKASTGLSRFKKKKKKKKEEEEEANTGCVTENPQIKMKPALDME